LSQDTKGDFRSFFQAHPLGAAVAKALLSFIGITDAIEN
jgi:hypothetical protein